MEFVGKGRYHLKRGNGKELKKLFNGVLLKEYVPSSSQPAEPSGTKKPAEPSGTETTQPQKKRKVLTASLTSCTSD